MKKIFLLVASFVFSAHAINCIEAFSISNGGSKKFDNTYTLDSTQSINGSVLSGFYYAHTTFNRDKNGTTESITKCTDECKTLSYKEVITQNDADNSITTNTYIDNHLTTSQTYFPEKDSTVAIQYSETDDNMEAMLTSYTVNDTIYGLQYFYDVYEGEGKFELMNSYYIALDSIDSSICYQYSLKNDPMSKYWIEKNDSSMTFFYSRIYDDEFVGKYYFSKIGSEGTTSLNHKIHPAIVNKKFQLFDLMGRPAKQKQHIIKVVK